MTAAAEKESSMTPEEFLALTVDMPNGSTSTGRQLLEQFYLHGRVDAGDAFTGKPMLRGDWSLCTVPFSDLRQRFDEEMAK